MATSIHGNSGTGAGCPWMGEPNRAQRQQHLVVDRADAPSGPRRAPVRRGPSTSRTGRWRRSRGSSTSVRRWLAYRTREQVRARHRRGGMARPGRGGGADAVHRDLRGEVVPELDPVVHRLLILPRTPPSVPPHRASRPRAWTARRSRRGPVGRHRPAHRTRPVLLALAGDSASGKSTLCAWHRVHPGRGARGSAICTDDYHRYDRATRARTGRDPARARGQPGRPHGGAPARAGRRAARSRSPPTTTSRAPSGPRRPSRRRRSSSSRGCCRSPSARARDAIDVAVYLEPEEILRRRWKLERDVFERGYSPKEVVDEINRREADAAAAHPSRSATSPTSSCASTGRRGGRRRSTSRRG